MKTNHYPIKILILIMLFSVVQLYAQSDREQIIQQRTASNEAIRALNFELSYTYLTDDVVVTTGSGTLLTGKDALRKYIANIKGSTMYFVRTPNEIEVNPEKKLAWESGNWKGYDLQKGKTVLVQGKYSAMWTKVSGKWLLKSQLFVTLN